MRSEEAFEPRINFLLLNKVGEAQLSPDLYQGILFYLQSLKFFTSTGTVITRVQRTG